MKVLIQRVKQASVTVEGKVVGEIGPGLLLLVGFEKADTEARMMAHVKKLLELRIFPDETGKMNRSVESVGGGLLVVSQFTLAGSCKKGTRPSFDNAMPPAQAQHFYERMIHHFRETTSLPIETGEFGAMMDVALVNDGPVTFMLED